jgi:methyl-accepting chemotaxis protein
MLDKDYNVILDYNPSKNGYKTKLIHDEKILNKYNLIKSGQPAALKLSKGEEGTLESVNSRYKVKQINAYKNVVGKKIVDDIGWKLLVRFDSDEAYARTNQSRNIFLVLFLILFLIIIGASSYFGTFLANKLKYIANNLSKGNQILIQTSKEATSESQKLSSSATQQASSLHETVTAVNEINAMMSRSSEMAINSQKKSEENISKVNEGKNTINNMIRSINNIKQSNQEIMEEVLESNKNISNIIKVISEIENKTKVINEIVFQTKLLSFNASVEAARAGEHGRGFSVVAEEVGNLAKMSGSASNEISTLLENSIHKVQSIVNQTKNNIDQILAKSKNTIKEGEEVSQECVAIFEQILINSEEVNTLVLEITNSAKEQAKGIYEINNAMHELDHVTNQNNTIAEKTTQTAYELLKQSNELEIMAKSLMEIIDGNDLKILKRIEA